MTDSIALPIHIPPAPKINNTSNLNSSIDDDCIIDEYDASRTIDDVLDTYHKNNEKILRMIEDNPEKIVSILWTSNSPLVVDSSCLCHMNKYRAGTFYSCPSCRIIGRLTDLNPDTINLPFEIEFGEMIGKHLVIVKNNNFNGNIVINQVPKYLLKKLLDNTNNIKACEPGLVDLTEAMYIGSDAMTNEILVTMAVEEKLLYSGIRGVCQIHTAFKCRNDGYILYESPNGKNIDNVAEKIDYIFDISNQVNDTSTIDPAYTRGILYHLLATLHALSYYNFTSGNPTISSLIFTREPLNYVYDGVHVVSPVTILLCSLKDAGITLQSDNSGPVRLYHRSTDLSLSMDQLGTNTLFEIVTQTIPNFSNKEDIQRRTWYRFSDEDKIKFFAQLRNMGAPLFPSSFDVYGFITSLMTYEPFYHSLKINNDLNKLWIDLWDPTELTVIENRIKRYHKNNELAENLHDIVEILAGLKLRCDALYYIWSNSKEKVNNLTPVARSINY